MTTHTVWRGLWASAIGYQKEDHTELVADLLRSAAISPEATVDVEGGRQFAVVSACRDPEGKGSPVLPEGCGGKGGQEPSAP